MWKDAREAIAELARAYRGAMVDEPITSGSTTPSSGRARDALALGATAVVWYSLPDHVTSPRTRGLLKAALLATAALCLGKGAAGAEGHAAGTTATTSRVRAPDDLDDQGVPDGARSTTTWRARSSPARRVVVVLGLSIASVLVSVGGGRGIYRLGERSARRGVSHPHTRNGLVFGLLTASAVLTGDRATG